MGKAINRFHFQCDDALGESIKEAMSRLELPERALSGFLRDSVTLYLFILRSAPAELRGLDLQVFVRDTSRSLAQGLKAEPSPESAHPRAPSNGAVRPKSPKPAR